MDKNVFNHLHLVWSYVLKMLFFVVGNVRGYGLSLVTNVSWDTKIVGGITGENGQNNGPMGQNRTKPNVMIRKSNKTMCPEVPHHGRHIADLLFSAG